MFKRALPLFIGRMVRLRNERKHERSWEIHPHVVKCDLTIQLALQFGLWQCHQLVIVVAEKKRTLILVDYAIARRISVAKGKGELARHQGAKLPDHGRKPIGFTAGRCAYDGKKNRGLFCDWPGNAKVASWTCEVRTRKAVGVNRMTLRCETGRKESLRRIRPQNRITQEALMLCNGQHIPNVKPVPAMRADDLIIICGMMKTHVGVAAHARYSVASSRQERIRQRQAGMTRANHAHAAPTCSMQTKSQE